MSKRLPVVRPKEAIGALEKAGWYTHHQRGSHVSMHKEGFPGLVIVPLHSGYLPKGTLHAIIEDTGLNIEQFLELL